MLRCALLTRKALGQDWCLSVCVQLQHCPAFSAGEGGGEFSETDHKSHVACLFRSELLTRTSLDQVFDRVVLKYCLPSAAKSDWLKPNTVARVQCLFRCDVTY